jgi:hypothetical protein
MIQLTENLYPSTVPDDEVSAELAIAQEILDTGLHAVGRVADPSRP